MIYRSLKFLRKSIEGRIHRQEPRPVLDPHDFPWTQKVESAHPDIRREALEVLKSRASIPDFNAILPNQRALTQNQDWKAYFLLANFRQVPNNARVCPRTILALQNIPGVMNAFFSILAPQTEIPAHRGPYAGLLRYHLGVLVPEGDLGIRVDQEICRWHEGRSLIFDDSFEHEAWNRTPEDRVVLFVDFVRPLRGAINFTNRLMIQSFSLTREARRANKIIQGDPKCPDM